MAKRAKRTTGELPVMKDKEIITGLNETIYSQHQTEVLLDAQIKDLQYKLSAAQAKADAYFKQWMEEQKNAGQQMSNNMELAKLQKQVCVIDHITAGRLNQAIQEILTPIPLLFGVDVRFADDKTRIAAEEEMLQKLKDTVIANVQGAKIQRGSKEEADSSKQPATAKKESE